MQKTIKSLSDLIPNLFYFLLLAYPVFLVAQPKNLGHKIDGVAAVIGDEIVTNSDIERDFLFAQQQAGEAISKCDFLDQALANKLLLHYSKNDTLVIVTNDQVGRQVEAQIENFRQRSSDDSEFLDALGYSTVAELRAELTNMFKDNAYTVEKQRRIVTDVDATPEEVRTFFNEHANELPDAPEELELAHLIINPELTEEHRKEIIEELNNIKKEIEDGASFETKAKLFSQGPSAADGGLIKNVKRKQMVPEFDAVVFNLEEGQISEPFETEFGYHIAILEKRKGQIIDFRHILIKPEFTTEEIQTAYRKLDSLRQEILNNKLTFKEAVRQYSTDKYTKYNGGVMTNQQSGESRFDRSKLPIKMLSAIVGLKEGELSYVFEDEFGEREKKKVLRLLEVQGIIPSHKVNFETDFSKLKNYTIQTKQQKALSKWIREQIPVTFVKIHPEFQSCQYEYDWTQNN